jgi:hypothetical protein
MVPPYSQNTVGICNQITLLFLYYISSRLVTFLKVIDVQVSDILHLTVNIKVIDFRFQKFFLFVPEMSNRITSFIVILSTLLCFGFCNHCILACLIETILSPKFCIKIS